MIKSANYQSFMTKTSAMVPVIMDKGLISIFTGNGKGKTTSALGLMFRASGHDHKVCFIQFIKGNWKCGEQHSVKKHSDNIEFHTLGKGFTWKSENIDEDIALAQKGWLIAKKKIEANEHKLIVLDELTYLIKYDMVAEEEIIKVIKNKSPEMHIVITGRDASEGLIEVADLVTEMKEVKHPYKSGVKAQKGFEF